MINQRVYHNLSHPQKRIWYVEKIYADSHLHNIGGYLKIKGYINFDMLEKAVSMLIQRNDGIRLRFHELDGQPFQYVEEFKEERIDFFDFSKCENPYSEHSKWLDKVFKERFILENSQLYYFSIYKLSEEDCGILLKIHHIIADGWSINLMQKQVCDIYCNLLSGESGDYAETSYIDFIQKEKDYLRSDKFYKNKKFWNEKFKDLPEKFLYKSSAELEGKRKTFKLDNELSIKIKELLSNEAWSLNTFFISILLTYLNKTTGEKDIVIGTPVFNRVGKVDKNTCGMFTSTMPVRYRINLNSTIKELINSVSLELKSCLLNQKYPYDILVSDLSLKKNGYDGLYQTCVNYYNTKYIRDMNGAIVEAEEYYNGNQNYLMQIVVKEWSGDESITLDFDYLTSIYSDEDVSLMYKHIIHLVCKILSKKDEHLKNLFLLDNGEYFEKIYKFNSTKADYPKEKTIYELFEKQAIETPDKIAVVFGEKSLIYRDLNHRSNQLAHFLRKRGISKESVVGIMIDHSIELIIGILGVIKAGAAYLPIDLGYPNERINFMLEDSKASILLINSEMHSEIRFCGEAYSLMNEEIWQENKCNLERINGVNDLVYIIYTSGSTGRPKGVMIEHKGLVNYIWWAKKMYLKGENEVFALYSSVSFDLTVTSIFTPLISGNTIAVYFDDGSEFILYRVLREKVATVIKLTPSHLTLLKELDNSESSVRSLIVGGENLKSSLAKSIHGSFGGKIKIYNEYGPTETVVGCMIYEYDPLTDINSSVPIGAPANNVQIYILDENLNLVPNGITGDIYVSGDGVSRGYLNREDLTSERFVKNSFIEDTMMYKTGDKGKYLKNGVIEYVGRSDNQVKIRGHRVELGEIEKYLLENKSIKEAMVIDKDDENGDKLLYAYIVAYGKLDVSELKNWLLSYVPKYMVPAQIIYLEEFPLTANGKVDMSRLPEAKEIDKEFIHPQNELESNLVDVIKQILGISEISMNDNFYQMGGDSIKAIQIASKLKIKGLDVKVKDILAQEVIKDIAATIQEIDKDVVIDQSIQSGTIMKTPIIEWFFSQKFTNRDYYNQSVLLKSKEKIKVSDIKKALRVLIEHHDSLRINYQESSKQLYFNNELLDSEISIENYDLSNFLPFELENKIIELGSIIKSKFDIEKGLLINISTFDLGDEEQAILFTAHHLIIDGVSWRILLADFESVIRQLINNEEAKLPLKTHSYREWSMQLQDYINTGIGIEEEYWNRVTDNDFVFPFDHELGMDKVSHSSSVSSVVDKKTIAGLTKSVQEIYSMNLNEILISALALTLSDITHHDNIVMVLEGHGRETINDSIDISRTLGWFTSMYSILLKTSNKDLDSNIKSLKEQLRHVPNNGFNFGILKHLMGRFTHHKAETIRFNYLGDFDGIFKSNDFEISHMNSGSEIGDENQLTALIDITAMIIEGNLRLQIIFSENKFKHETIQMLMNSYTNKLIDLLEYCRHKNEKEYTPSDFEDADISQEDLDILFG